MFCYLSDSTVSEDAGIEPRTVEISALAVRRSNKTTRLYLIHKSRCTTGDKCAAGVNYTGGNFATGTAAGVIAGGKIATVVNNIGNK